MLTSIPRFSLLRRSLTNPLTYVAGYKIGLTTKEQVDATNKNINESNAQNKRINSLINRYDTATDPAKLNDIRVKLDQNGMRLSEIAFVEDINKQIADINNSINLYHHPKNDKKTKTELLKAIYQKRQLIENIYKGDHILIYNLEWEAIEATLFEDLTSEAKTLGFESIRHLMMPVSQSGVSSSPLSHLSDIIADLTPDDAEIFAKCLLGFKEYGTQNLKYIDGIADFFESNEIAFLGGGILLTLK